MVEPDDQPGADPAALVAGYEALRSAVAAGAPEGWRLGHALLARRGMAAWMAAWTAPGPAPDAGTPAPDALSNSSIPSRPPPAAVPAALTALPRASQIVAVLAQMALAHVQPASS